MIRILFFHLSLLLMASLNAASQSGEPAALTSQTLAGLELRSIGPANMSGRVVDLAVVESDTYVFYIASATGGLWKTTDNGVTFTPLFDREAVHSIGAIALHQANPDILWLGSGERANRQSSSWGDGVYKSTDGGKTWTNMGLGESHHIGRIVIHPKNPDVVYVAAAGHLWGPNEERGLFKTTDGGKTWQNILFINEDTGVIDVAMDPSDPRILYAAAYQRRRRAYGFHGGGPGSGLYKSTDEGRNWKELTKGLPEGDKGRIGISVYRKNPRIVYVCVEQGLRYTASTSYEERKAGIYRSEDKGESWQFMSDWNPRPMYASQIQVDPNDDQRVYMMNSYSYSDDGGKTFTRARQSLHGDDRILWVDPGDSRHIIKGDDGGVGISYDRGLKWLYVTSLPLSQFYRVGVDMRKPYWVYGGLQDNGSWMGPSATYFSSGILNEDWMRTGGGDGFFNVVDPTDNRTLYTNSQYLGLTRVDLVTREVRNIRPDNPRGFIGGRRNWKTWGKPDVPEPLLGNAMAPANWDAPLILSPHDPQTLYAGTNQLWKSTNRGDSWTSLGDLTTKVDRSRLKIMGQTPNEETLSLDDGIPYYPTVTAIAESPLRQGLLYVGTDDGNLQVSRDGGDGWTNVGNELPGLPPASWVAGIEASRHEEGVVYAAFDNHRSDDFENYLFRSSDYGESWRSIAGDLPSRRVVRAVHEDPQNPHLLYIGTELGFFLSADAGRHWVELKNNMPTMAINDFVIHPRDNDLVLATHSRGIWILDNLSSLQELTPEVLASDAHLFTIEPARMIRYTNVKAHAGDMIFRGENPPEGAVIDFYLGREGQQDVSLTIHDLEGEEIARVRTPNAKGINRAIWNLRYASLPPVPPEGGDSERQSERTGPDGPFVMPGDYIVRLAVGGARHEQRVKVEEDPRIQVSSEVRRTWTDTLLQVADLYKDAVSALGRFNPEESAEAKERQEVLQELIRRISSLYSAMDRWTGPPTADQNSQMQYFAEVLEKLAKE